MNTTASEALVARLVTQIIEERDRAATEGRVGSHDVLVDVVDAVRALNLPYLEWVDDEGSEGYAASVRVR